MTRMKERQSNLELLRILCALFVLAFHLISQSDALGDLNTQNFTFSVFSTLVGEWHAMFLL